MKRIYEALNNKNNKEKIIYILFQTGLGGILTTMLSMAWVFSAYALIYENQFMPSIAEGGRFVDYFALVMGMLGGLVWIFSWLLAGALASENESEKTEEKKEVSDTVEYEIIIRPASPMEMYKDC